jgi:hypothetical protein
MKNFRAKFVKNIRYLFVAGIISLGLIAIVGSNGGGGGTSTTSVTDGSGGGDTGDGSTTTKSGWTYMVYIAGDNNLSSAAIGDINEMEQVGSSDDVNIVVQVEFSQQYTPDMPENTLRGKITKDSDQFTISTQYEDIGNKDMGAKETLTEFIQWATTNYPADYYALVLWDHGAGWKRSRKTGGAIRGALQDTTSGSFMSLPDLASGVEDSGVHLDLINFDACLMAMYEVVYEFNGLTDYMVFSEEVEPGEGDPYDTILQELVNNPGMTASELAETITSKYKTYYQLEARSKITKSAVDMTKTTELDQKITELVQLMNDNMGSERPNIQSARDDSVSYEYPENHDLGDFLEKLENATSNNEILTKIDEIQNTLSTMVVSNEIYCPQENDPLVDSNGLAIFLPKRDQVTDADLSNYALLTVNQERDFAPNTWGSFVNTLITGDEDAGVNPLETGVGNFVIWLEWDSDADLDLIIWEPDGSFAAPFIGTSSSNAFLSEDSYFSGDSFEYYAALETVEEGRYDILVNYYADGSSSGATAYLYFLDPANGIDDFTLLGYKDMDLSNQAPADWLSDTDEMSNVWYDLYSDWWWWYNEDYLYRSMRIDLPLDSPNKMIELGNSRVHIVGLPPKEKAKKLPRFDKDTADEIRQMFENRSK